MMRGPSVAPQVAAGVPVLPVAVPGPPPAPDVRMVDLVCPDVGSPLADPARLWGALGIASIDEIAAIDGVAPGPDPEAQLYTELHTCRPLIDVDVVRGGRARRVLIVTHV
jgi:hypothetical protein